MALGLIFLQTPLVVASSSPSLLQFSLGHLRKASGYGSGALLAAWGLLQSRPLELVSLRCTWALKNELLLWLLVQVYLQDALASLWCLLWSLMHLLLALPQVTPRWRLQKDCCTRT
mmetsp:Transcript_9893/g.21004  ORF Transcript_9893/g.21004 Transcript_9893/m.21004 type:complete len:116 (-) Transcript_9893:764-1111(-)